MQYWQRKLQRSVTETRTSRIARPWPSKSCSRAIARYAAYAHVRPPCQLGELATASPNAIVCASTSAGVVAGDTSAMLWNGVIITPRLSAWRCR